MPYSYKITTGGNFRLLHKNTCIAIMMSDEETVASIVEILNEWVNSTP